MSHASMHDINSQFEKIDLLDRISDLKKVTGWSMEHGGFTSGQRICISQERAGCLKQITAIENCSPYQGIAGYKIPEHLEEKVHHILGVIKNTGWIKEEIKY